MNLLGKTLFAAIGLTGAAWAQPCAQACGSGQDCGAINGSGFYQAQYSVPPSVYNSGPWANGLGGYAAPPFPYLGGQQASYYPNQMPYSQPYAPFYPNAPVHPLQVVGPLLNSGLLNGLLNR